MPLGESELDLSRSLTLLCVEDSEVTRMIFESILKDHFKTILFANDGLEGYQIFLDEEIDLIITDYQMPRCSGLDMIQNIRLIDHEIPIIMATGSDESSVLIEAIRNNVTNFFLKPINPSEVLEEVQKISKMIAIDRYLKEKKQQRLQKLEDQFNYNDYQEKLTFQKELQILRNDLHHRMIEVERGAVMFDYVFKPLDTLSGDAFSARYLASGGVLLLLVDGMGKGISASLSAMLITAFVNYEIDKNPAISLDALVEEALRYIKTVLMHDEILSIEFVFTDHGFETLRYAKFSMPATLMMHRDRTITKLKSNNPPVSRFTQRFEIDEVSIADVEKILLTSDGITENTTVHEGRLYAQYLGVDFAEALSKNELYTRFTERIETQQDDVTFILLHTIEYSEVIRESRTFLSRFEELDNANEWFTRFFAQFSPSQELTYKAEVTFGELMMNAFEHGNLGIALHEKHHLIKTTDYYEYLKERSETSSKQITVSLGTLEYGESRYVSVIIEDEGEGFDTAILDTSFKNIHSFNGRGIYLARSNVNALYYNRKGNKVFFLVKC